MMVSNKLSTKAWVPRPKICKPPPPPDPEPVTAGPIPFYLEAVVMGEEECPWGNWNDEAVGGPPAFELGTNPPPVDEGYVRFTTDAAGQLLYTALAKVNTECGSNQLSRSYDPPLEKNDPPNAYIEEDLGPDSNYTHLSFDW